LLEGVIQSLVKANIGEVTAERVGLKACLDTLEAFSAFRLFGEVLADFGERVTI
jgi:hypothetical protein